MRIGLIEFLLILAIASLTVGPRVALFVDRWMRRANRANAMAARRRAEYAAQMAAERDAMLKRFRTASTVFGVGILLVLVYALGFRPIATPPQTYKAPDLRQETGAMQTAVSTDRKDRLELGEYQGVDCIRAKDGLLYAAAWNGAALKKRTSDLVRTDGGHAAAILSVEGELTGFAFDAAGDVWLTQLTTAGGTLCRAKHDSWGAAVEQVVTQLDGAPLGAVSAVEVSPAGKVYFAVAAAAGAENGLESALRTELLAHTAPSGAPSSWVTTCSTAAPQLSCFARQRVPPAVVSWVSHTSPAASKAKPVSSPSTLRMAAAWPPSVRTRSLVRFFSAAPFHAAAYKSPSFARMQSTP